MYSLSFWKGKSVLVTGSDGFCGSALCRALLDEGAYVDAMVRSLNLKNIIGLKHDNLRIVVGNVLDPQSLMEIMDSENHEYNPTDIVFHLAAITYIPESSAMVKHTFDVNALGTLNVLNAAVYGKVDTVVYTSTCHVYGKQDVFPITEEAKPNPLESYAASKLVGEHVCDLFKDKLRVVVTRAFNIYGPHQRRDFLIPKITTTFLRGDELMLGARSPTRDYIYIEDAINGYLKAAEHGKTGERYNICCEDEYSVSEVVEAIKNTFENDWSLHPPKSVKYSLKRKIDVPRLVGTYSKAHDELRWFPRISFGEGLKKTLEWYRETLR